ncbi:hypothetical protein M899_1447 [Bacteriovorax sp. BSW11_IV]|uniref:AgmX/PglI C-terminal domain-containing protein n=1 Tax=Bacteriovorax sp. BSW11_IV TaxID=1353529 RepID=UPI00038A525D|nr:AgmX/PglI C-terminal domain-containing protein [Bacteriovorax sp. BSW11_IV]EQC48354.1 hypothetical protein M899_1447 [Bacteriovorax sp. BSW11_IV]
MKMDSKNLIIVVLIVIVAFLTGRNFSGQQKANSAPAPIDPKIAVAYKQKEVAKTIRENAKDIQKCYLSYLENKPEMNEGVIKILFKLRENGSVESSEAVSNDFENISFGDCVAKKFERYYFAPPPIGMNRNILHELAFKTQETAEREAKERSEQSALPKILPVSPQ